MQALELKVPPVVLAAIVGVGMWGAAKALPGLAVAVPASTAVAGLLVALGGAVGLAGVVAFRASRTTVDPTRPARASSLVHAGVYRRTRNPMYLGLALGLAGWAIHLSNWAAVALLPVFVAYMTRFQIKPEERALLEKFGPSFAAYLASVRRWI